MVKRIVKLDEYTYMDTKTGEKIFYCVGCDKRIRWREFEVNKGYCDDCRDGRNEAYYRGLH